MTCASRQEIQWSVHQDAEPVSGPYDMYGHRVCRSVPANGIETAKQSCELCGLEALNIFERSVS